MDKANERLHEYELQLQEHELSGVPQDSERQVWTFWGALFYAGTIFTTIGYGHIAPATTAGQAITIAYAFIGIPFLLMVLADLGKLFTRWIKAVLYYTKLFCKTGKFRQKKEKQTTATPIQYMSVAPNKMSYTVPYDGRESNSGTPAEQGADDVKDSDKNTKENLKDKKKSDNEVVEEINTKDFAIASEEEEVDEEFNIPVTLAIFLLIAYMMLGALLFTLWEDWTFTESFYFIFVSMSTIGFGDFVPTHQMYMMATFIYLLFGLALTSMCINVVQEKLSLTFQAAKLRIGTTMGLDTSTLVDDDRMSDEASSRRGSKSRRSSKSARSTTPQAEDDQALQPESKD
ncbi:hypothetical protein JTE90_018918 [Oedothorax gibbosus]|uniref:Potassium channel domain-containing protein n=1 Tax=Oedothorax gibbosus TaxID=931172 RepID=A0AAV6VTV2_9ARAC|nr:hypothetical protein JTE90_018918 [Oedothorax gibbosus]